MKVVHTRSINHRAELEAHVKYGDKLQSFCVLARDQQNINKFCNYLCKLSVREDRKAGEYMLCEQGLYQGQVLPTDHENFRWHSRGHTQRRAVINSDIRHLNREKGERTYRAVLVSSVRIQS